MLTLQLKPLSVIALFFMLSVNLLFSQGPIKILPLGNSMTEGWMDGTESEGNRIAYRYQLKQLLTASGYNIDFVGSKSTGCNIFSDCQNGGISGTRDQFLETMISTGFDPRWGIQETPGPYLDSFNPDIIILSVGTNDITHDGTLIEPNAIANQRVSAILDQIDAYEARAGKEVTVFLALIINRRRLANGNEAPKTYTTSLWNTTMETMALQRIANGDKIVIVDMEHDAGFSYAYTSPDFCATDPEGLHPSTSGYTKMANLWYQAIINNYNVAPVIDAIPNQSMSEGGTFTTVQLDNYVYDKEDADQYITWTATQLNTTNLNININSSRQAIITPLDQDWNGSQTVVFKATDRGISGNAVKFDTDTVVFTVSAVNDPPSINAQSILSVNEDNSITLSLSNFTVYDSDSDPSTFQLIVLPGTNYTFSGIQITPSVNFSGSLLVNVAVRDNIAQGPSYPAQITVNAVNDAPVYSGQPDISIEEDGFYITDLGVFNVNDPDNTIEQLTLHMSPGANYTIEGNTIRPNSNYNGVLYVESVVKDPQNASSASFYIQITVNPVNDLPVFSSKPIDTINVNNQYVYSIKVADPDVDDILVYSAPIMPTWMTFYANSKLIAGVPNSGGNYPITLSVNDGHVTQYQSFILHVNGPVPIFEDESENTSIYPNPAHDFIVIDLQGRTESLDFLLIDMTGRSVLKRTINAGSETVVYFDGNQLAPGTYIFVLSGSNGISRGKLIIE